VIIVELLGESLIAALRYSMATKGQLCLSRSQLISSELGVIRNGISQSRYAPARPVPAISFPSHKFVIFLSDLINFSCFCLWRFSLFLKGCYLTFIFGISPFCPGFLFDRHWHPPRTHSFEALALSMFKKPARSADRIGSQEKPPPPQ